MKQEKIKKTIEDIINKTSCVVSSCEINEENGTIWCSVETPDSRFLIGHEGETLRSLNHIVKRLLEKEFEPDDLKNLFIDINGYQKKRFDNLKNIAHMMAERARYFKSNIEVDPMPAYERRIIHTFLEDSPNIKTESDGFGSNRRVVIKYIE